MKTLKLMLLSAGMILSSIPALQAQQAKIVTSDQDGWRKVAETTVDFEKDKDVLMVFGKDRFSKLQFMVMDAPIEITNMVVYYEGGTHDTINIASRIEEGGRSRVIDMQGGKPEIGRIVFNYKTSNENWNSSSSMSTDKTTRSASTSTTKKTTTDDGSTVTGTTTTPDKTATTTENKNTSKAEGEPKLNRSTKARVILWGMQ